MTDILRYAILTVAWMIFSGPTNYMSLATAAFYGVGFYIAAVLNGPLPFAADIIVAGAVSFVVALLVGALTLRLKGVYFCIFTFALTLLVNNVVLEVERLVTGTRGRFVETETVHAAYYAMFIVAIVTIVVAAMIRRSRYGLALQSIGEYEEAAAHSGINVVRTKVLVFAAERHLHGHGRRHHRDPTRLHRPRHRLQPQLVVPAGAHGAVRRNGQPRRAGDRSRGLHVHRRAPAHQVPGSVHAHLRRRC